MFDILKKYNKKIFICFAAIIVLFWGLGFLSGKGKNSLTEHQRRLKQYNQVQDGDEAIDGTDYVTFDAFFLEDLDNDGNAEGIRGNAINISKSKKLWLELKIIGDVSLKNGSISFENSNVIVGGNINKSTVFKNNISSNNITSIILNDNIGNGVSSLTSLNVEASLTNDLKSYSGINKVIFDGVVVDNQGNETKIRKEISYQADWYGTSVKSTIRDDYETNYIYYKEFNDNAIITYDVKINATTDMLLKSTNYEGVIGQLNGYDPVNVTVEGHNITSSYDPTTRTFTAKREAILDNSLITTQAYDYKNNNALWNELKITVEFPSTINHINSTLLTNLKVWHEAYNNQGSEFENVILSTPVTKILAAEYRGSNDDQDDNSTGYITKIDIGSYSDILGSYYVNKSNLLNLYDGNKTNSTTKYNRTLTLICEPHIFNYSKPKIIIKDADYDKIGSTSLDGISSYSSVRFSNVSNILRYLGTTGYIKMINDDTDEVIHIFTVLDWNNIYTFETNDVYKLRFETSPLTEQAYQDINQSIFGTNESVPFSMFEIIETKSINDVVLKEIYSKEDAERLNYIEGSTITEKCYNDYNYSCEPGATDPVRRGIAKYVSNQSSPLSAKIYNSAFNQINQLSTIKEENIRIEVETTAGYDVIKEWKDGEFLIALPSQMLDFDIIDVITNNNDIKVIGYEKVKINGRICIRIITENDTPRAYKLNIFGKVKPDVRTATGTYQINIYGINPGINPSEHNTNDFYDLDSDLDTNERVNYVDIPITLTSPNEVITTTTLTNYNQVDETSVSPQIAEVNSIVDDSDATVGIGITNGSQYSIKDIVVIGKIGFVGNTYQVGNGNLGSEYDIHMAATGITIPDTLVDKVTVYYSNYETPTNDLNDVTNNWQLKENIADFNSIKSYMIVINDFTLLKNRTINFTYDVEMPLLTSNLNKVTYFTHGVYYNVITDSGDYASSVGGSKLGIRMSRQYDLELTNKKIASDRNIAKSRYLVTDEEGQNHILVTNNEGKAVLKDLYVGKEYTIRQISVKSPYILDKEEKSFKLINDVNNNLVLQSNGKYKSINIATDKKLETVLENETRYTIVLNNNDLDTNESIAYSQFRITGKGYEDGITTMTNSDDLISLSNLYLDEVYEIEQVKTNNYLIGNKFTIKLIRDANGDVKITYGKKVSIGDVVKAGNYGFNYNEDDNYYHKENSTYKNTFKSYIPIDLTGLSGKYKITVPYKYYSSYTGNTFKLYITDTIDGYVTPFLNKNKFQNSNINYATTTNFYKYNSSTNTYDIIDIDGGKVYYLYMEQYYSNYTSYDYFYDPVVELINGDEFEYVVADSNDNIEVLENKNVRQSLQDSNNQDAPILTVNVKNAKIPSYTLNITKVNADTKETLAGAQYKVTGPGLPETGKYVTTDENGHASINLYKKMYLQDQNTINGIDYKQYESEYTIQEVVAPVGYTLDYNSITFHAGVRLQNGQMNNNDYVTDLTTENAYEIQYSLNSEGEFKEYTWDNDNKSLNVIMYDYPIITITKKDSETGELLPNTLFAIYEVTMVNGTQVYSPAHDADGNIVGSQVTINGKTYYVVATDENGQLSLNLGAGSYRLQEVQASNEKYEISNVVYNFGVGETVPYQSANIELLDNFAPVNSSFYLGSNNYADKIKPTSDGGYIMVSPNNHFVAKYDADYNVEWQVDSTIYYNSSSALAQYYDNPTRYDYFKSSSTLTEYANDIIETSDGGFVMQSYKYDLLVKLDQNGNRVWQNRDSYYTYMRTFNHVCTYEGNTNELGQVKSYYYDSSSDEWVARKNWSTGEDIYYDFDYDYNHMVSTRDNETYYCGYTESYNNGNNGTTYKYVNTNFNTSGPGSIVPTNDGGVLDFVHVQTYSDYLYYAKLKDGTLAPIESKYIIIKYDSNGDIINIYNLDEITRQADADYIERYGLNKTPKSMEFDYSNKGISLYPNGDILLISAGSTGSIIKLRYNEQIDNFETVFFTPLGINGYNFDYFFDNFDGNIDLQSTNEGGFVLSWGGYSKQFGRDYFGTSYNKYYDTEKQAFDYDTNNSFYRNKNTGAFNVLYDGEGKIKDFTILYTTNRHDYTIGSFGFEDIKHIYGNIYGMFYLYQDDGSYLVGGGTSGIPPYNPNSGSSDGGTKFVQLASGEIFTIDGSATYIIYKINSDGYIDWIKQYKGIQPVYNSSSPGTIKEIKSADGKKFIIPVTASGTVEEIGNNSVPLIENVFGQTFLVFGFKDELVPEGPEAYTLNIENKRKEYKVTATSNVGGEVVVTNPDNGQNIVTTDGSTTILEKVKYGDTNKYDITIIPEVGYVISSIKVNGEDTSFKVNDDLSITLDKITNIKEDKNIQIMYQRGLSTVIVKHYLKDTNESIFSDEIIHGIIATPYSVQPKISNLYSLVSENNEIVLPNNMQGLFNIDPITVVFYYVKNDVNLQTNYYIDGTEIELAPTLTERKTLGSRYKTSPIKIDSYKLTRVIGVEEGTLTQDLTQVTYMYQENTESKITVRFVDKATGKDIADPITKIVSKNSGYNTEESTLIPSNYRFISKTTNASGIANEDEIEVIYYYEVIPFNIAVDKKVISIILNNKTESIKNGKEINIKARETDDIIVYYEINVENNGEIKAAFKVEEEEIPNFEIYDKGEFKQEGNKYILEKELEPGTKATYKIGYKWIKNKYGVSINEVEIKEVTNDVGFEETNSKDNKSTAKVIIEKTKDIPVITDVPEDNQLQEKSKIPNTYDNLCQLIALFMMSLTGLALVLLYLKKNE